MQLLRRKPKSAWAIGGRDNTFWKNLLNQKSPDCCWKKNFQLSRGSFFLLHKQFSPCIATDLRQPNYRCLSWEKKLALTLYLKDTGSLWMTVNRFVVHQSAAPKTIVLVYDAINKHLSPVYLHMPQDKDDLIQKVSEYKLKFGIIQGFGCIDDTHIPLKTPRINSQDYFNNKQFYSINVQAIYDCHGLFMDIGRLWPGSVHDAKLSANSEINEKRKNGLSPKTFSCPVLRQEKIPN